MAPTTVTTIVMIAFALCLLAMASWAWFGDWQPEPTRLRPEERFEAEYEAAVAQLRREISDYERRSAH